MNRTKIEWTQNGWTWNTVTGCTHVSDGCRFCYAEALSLRFKRSAHPWTAPYEAENVKLHPERLMQPLAVKDPAYVFADSMADLFHRLVPDQHIIDVFAVMALTPHLTYQILTKRPERMAALVRSGKFQHEVYTRSREVHGERQMGPLHSWPGWPLPNVWLGTSVEDQRVVERIDHLLAAPAAVRFLSCEPLLGPLDLTTWFACCPSCGNPHRDRIGSSCPVCESYPEVLRGVDWVIVGGESGAGFRPMDPVWAADIRNQCLAFSVPYFFKQHGGRTPKAGGRLLEGVEWSQFPTVGSAVSS